MLLLFHENGGDPLLWLELSWPVQRIAQGNRAIHELRVLCGAFRYGGMVDHLGLPGCICFEEPSGQVLAVIKAYSDPNHMNWSASRFYTGSDGLNDADPAEMHVIVAWSFGELQVLDATQKRSCGLSSLPGSEVNAGNNENAVHISSRPGDDNGDGGGGRGRRIRKDGEEGRREGRQSAIIGPGPEGAAAAVETAAVHRHRPCVMGGCAGQASGTAAATAGLSTMQEWVRARGLELVCVCVDAPFPDEEALVALFQERCNYDTAASAANHLERVKCNLVSLPDGVCVCVCVCVCVYVYVCLCVCMHACTHVNVYVLMYV